MPELPEVETIARTLRPLLVGRQILGATVRWPRTIAVPTPGAFRKRIEGQIIKSVERRAKFLHIELSASHLLIHLRMSGDLHVRHGKPAPAKHDRLILFLSREKRHGSSRRKPTEQIGSSLVFNDTRKFGRVWLTDNLESVTGGLGPEPLESAFTAELLLGRLRARRRRLKSLLLDQGFLAGMGNIYTDEALHLAKLHPLKSSQSISRVQARRLHRAIRLILREGIRRNGASIDWVYRGGDFQNHFRVYDREGQPCPVCGTTIRRLIVGQRGTHICPRCQRI
jgi:formamidopyrimidine-DNA glycosylase